MKIFLAFLIISVSYNASAQVAKSVILEKFLKGGVKTDKIVSEFPLRNLSPDQLAKVAGRQKLVNPKFDVDLLYYHQTYDDQHNYKIQYHFPTSKCLYSVEKREIDDLRNKCIEEYMACIGDIDRSSSSEIYKCMVSGAFCKKVQGLSVSSEEIDIKFCEKVYGRKL